jgi:hypothetical protein
VSYRAIRSLLYTRRPDLRDGGGVQQNYRHPEIAALSGLFGGAGDLNP